MDLDKLRKQEDRPEVGVVGTPQFLVEEILNQYPSDVFASSTTTFLDPCFGNGTFLIGVVRRLLKYGHSIENINSRVFGVELGRGSFNRTKMRFKKSGISLQLFNEDALKKVYNMEFDAVLGNVPFNLASASTNTIAGTSGNTTYYKKFIDLANSVKKSGLFSSVNNSIPFSSNLFSFELAVFIFSSKLSGSCTNI